MEVNGPSAISDAPWDALEIWSPTPDHHSCQRLTNPSTSELLQEIKATFLLYYPVIFMLGGKVNVRDCRSTRFAAAAKEPSEHKEVLLPPA